MKADKWWNREYNSEIYHVSGGVLCMKSLCGAGIFVFLDRLPKKYIPKDKLCQKCLSIVADNPNRVRDSKDK